jgi:hypothetical protein
VQEDGGLQVQLEAGLVQGRLEDLADKLGVVSGNHLPDSLLGNVSDLAATSA